MTKINIIATFFGIMLSITLCAQNKDLMNSEDIITKYDRSTGYYYREHRPSRVKIVEGFITVHPMRHCSTPQKNGTWIERYLNGKIKVIGEYYCNNRYGKWTYFTENGALFKVETYGIYAEEIKNFDNNLAQPLHDLKKGEQIYINKENKIISEYFEVKIGIDSTKIIDPIDYSINRSFGKTLVSYKLN